MPKHQPSAPTTVVNTDRLQGGHEKGNKFRKQKPKAKVSEVDRLGMMKVAGRAAVSYTHLTLPTMAVV